MSNQREGIIVVGVPRSGTTLVRRLLNAHPQIACPGETNLFCGMARFLESDTIAQGVDIGVLAGLSFAGFAEDQVLERLRDFIFGFLREYASREGKPRWAEKTAFNAFYLDSIERICAEHVQFVCVQRHGLDVVGSLQELCEKNGGYLPELHKYIVRYPRPLEAFAHAWAELAASIGSLADRRPEVATLVRYEDLVADPGRTMRQVVEFLGESWTPELITTAMKQTSAIGLGDWKTYGKSTIDSGSVRRWQHWPPATISALARIVNPTLEACGYEAVPVDDAAGADEARRRYELGLMIQSMKGGRADAQR